MRFGCEVAHRSASRTAEAIPTRTGEMSGACSILVCGEVRERDHLQDFRRRWEDNINTNLKGDGRGKHGLD